MFADGSGDTARQLLATAAVLLLTIVVLLSAVATVPVAGSANAPAENGSGNSGGESTSSNETDTFESFSIDFDAADPEEPRDVQIQWNLSANATDVETVQVAITSDGDSPINLYRPTGQDVPNPFTVSEASADGKPADIVVDNLSTVSFTLKIPPGHCGRVESVEVTALEDNSDRSSDPDIDRTTKCTPNTAIETFEVAIDEYDQTVTAGETVNVTAEVENTGTAEGTQDIQFLVDGEEHARTNLTLATNQSETVEFTYETNRSDVGNLSVAVESDDDRAERTVNVTEPAFFAVTIEEYDQTVTAGESVNVTAEVENTGHNEDTQDVQFLIDGDEHERTNLTLGPGQNETVTFTYETDESDVGEHQIAVESEDDRANRTVNVTEPAFFDVSIEDAPAEATAGEWVNVTAQIQNTGDHTDTQNVTLADFDGEVVDTNHSLALSPNESTTVTLQWSTNESDAGTGNVTVSSADDAETAAIELTQPTVESITATLQDSVIQVGEETSITVEATYTDGSTQIVTDNATLTANDTAVATVDSGGTVSAEGEGTTGIEAAFEGETDTESLTVEPVDDSDGDSGSGDDSNGDSGSNDDSDDNTESDDSLDDSEPDNSGDNSGSDDSTDDGSGSDAPAGGGGGTSPGGAPTGGDDTSSEGTGDSGTEDSSTDEPPESEGPTDADDSGVDDSESSEAESSTEDDSQDSRSGREDSERTTIAFFPVLGLLLLPPVIVWANGEWF